MRSFIAPLAMLVAVPALAQDDLPRMGVAMTVDVTPAQLTEPITDYSCRAETPDGDSWQFSIRYTGTRGYVDPTSGEVRTTKALATFGGRDAALFSNYQIRAWTHAISGSTDDSNVPLSQWFEIEFPRTQMPYEISGSARVGLLINRKSMPETLLALGYCDRRFTDQQPLADAEIAEEIAR